MATIIVSYDGTENDTDALALGKLLASGGAKLALAYVRHAAEPEVDKEIAAQKEASALLEAGAAWLGDPDVPQHVVLSASTPAGLRELAESQGADVIVFGSEYRTSPGHIDPGTSAQRLLEGGPLAVAIAPAGFKGSAETIETIASISEDGDPATAETAAALAATLGASVVTHSGPGVGLAVVGSKPGTAGGRVTLSAAAQYLIEMLDCPVLVLPHGVALRL